MNGIHNSIRYKNKFVTRIVYDSCNGYCDKKYKNISKLRLEFVNTIQMSAKENLFTTETSKNIIKINFDGLYEDINRF